MRHPFPRFPLAGAALPVLAFALVTGCAAPPSLPETGEDGSTVAEGDVGDEEDGDTSRFAYAVSAQACSREKILGSVEGPRKTAIERGFSWLDAKVRYSQSRSFEGYRTDCSGFVSMAWELDRSYTTADFVAGGGHAHRLAGYDALEPGDALVHRSGGSGHVVLFLGWADAGKSAACVLEQASSRSNMQFRARTTSSLRSGGYKAIEADALRGVPPKDDTEPTGDAPAADDPGAEDPQG